MTEYIIIGIAIFLLMWVIFFFAGNNNFVKWVVIPLCLIMLLIDGALFFYELIQYIKNL